jgi:hypothetical protein
MSSVTITQLLCFLPSGVQASPFLRVINELAHLVGERRLLLPIEVDGVHVNSSAAMGNNAFRVFKEIFVKTGNPGHYEMMNPLLATGPTAEYFLRLAYRSVLTVQGVVRRITRCS